MKSHKPYRLIISGGGTGGHIFPAIAIANEFRERHPDSTILFIGAKGKMEMTKIPEAGYKIIGLWISGLQRRFTWRNILFPIKLIFSYLRAVSILQMYKPNIVIGTGGYASGPIMLASTTLGYTTMIQEQNSFAGLTNKRIANKVNKICVAYQGMEKYFPANKIVLTGNPVRKNLLQISSKKEQALHHFGFEENKKTLLIIGGSLGARTINESIVAHIDKLIAADIQILWQAGKAHYTSCKEALKNYNGSNIRLYDFLKEMDMAYTVADVVISRSGALAVSELCIAKKATILVPSPNVAEDHQTKNAMALLEKNATILIKDEEAREKLVEEALQVLFDEDKLRQLENNIAVLAKPNATQDIVNEIEKLIG